jgi:penicillin-binding protein 1A
MKFFLNILNITAIFLISLFLIITSVFWYFGKDLPNFEQLSDYEPPIVSRIFASDGNFLEEYSRENRIFSSFEHFPKNLVHCFLVAEDTNFYSHVGFDLKSIMRAFVKNISNIFNSRRPEGASTITQQVAKNFLLSGEISYSRKIKEIILSLRIENILSKNEILELYLNEIYLGNRSFGVSAASINYFNKSLHELNIEEMALLAALPKAPSTYNPFVNPNKALKRRNWVLFRLFSEGLIDIKQYENSINSELTLKKKKKIFSKKASFFKEEIRREIIEKYDEKKLYDQGLSIISSLDTELQIIAEKSFQDGIRKFDKRKGWRGPFKKIEKMNEWESELNKIKRPHGMYNSKLAVIINIDEDQLKIGVKNLKKMISLKKENLKIIYNVKNKDLKKIFKVGDVLIVDKESLNGKEIYNLAQIPNVNGGLVVIENHSGRVLAMVGGYDSGSSFNRVTQAKRQPGSAFKPFVYITALENKFTPVSKILDAPVVIENPTNLKKWRPTNYGKKFFGPSTLRLGIEKSRNLMTVRLAKLVGLEKIGELSKNLDIYEKFPSFLSSPLGSVETSLLKISSAYASIANGGFKLEPSFIDKIQDRHGKILYKKDNRACFNCELDFEKFSNQSLKNLDVFPDIIENRKRVISEESSYQMTSFLMGVIERGTAKNIKYLDFEVAGKTGTTNNNQDAWFIGYNSEITVGVYVGYDKPKTLGKSETGSRVAAPIFGDFMSTAYDDKKPYPFLRPEGVKFINIDSKSGEPTDEGYIQEVFKKSFNFDQKSNINLPSEEDYNTRGFY